MAEGAEVVRRAEHQGSEEGGSETPCLLTLQGGWVSRRVLPAFHFQTRRKRGAQAPEAAIREYPPPFIGRADFSPHSCLSSWPALPSAGTPGPAHPHLCVSLRLSVCLCVSLCLSVSISFSVSVSVSLCLSLFVSVCPFVSVPVSMSLSACLSVCPHLRPL